MLRKRHRFVVSALTSHQFCHNYAPASTKKPHCVDCRVHAPIETAELSQSVPAAMSARNQTLHCCARCLVWPRHHGQQKSTTSVVCITQQEEQLIPLLGTIESHASKLACIRIEAARITQIRKLHGQLLENHRAGSEQERRGPLMRSSFSTIRGAEAVGRRCENHRPHRFSRSPCPTDWLYLR